MRSLIDTFVKYIQGNFKKSKTSKCELDANHLETCPYCKKPVTGYAAIVQNERDGKFKLAHNDCAD